MLFTSIYTDQNKKAIFSDNNCGSLEKIFVYDQSYNRGHDMYVSFVFGMHNLFPTRSFKNHYVSHLMNVKLGQHPFFFINDST